MSKLYVQLGRIGDILAILPLLYADHQSTGIRSGLMVAREFASVLDGCSYVEPIVFDGDYRELERAVYNARAISDEVIVTSIHGSAEAVEKHAYSQIGKKGATSSSFQKEAWLLAGRLSEWDDNLPLVFDMRSSEREKRLLDASGILKMRKPIILLSLGGQTAPFPHADLLRDYIHAKFDKSHRVIELPMTEDGHCYDLLAVMERAALLITTDSMPLHLAWACRSLPVFALTNDRDSAGNPSLWHGSPWRPNHLWYCRYHDWPTRAQEMCDVVSSMTHKKTLINYSDDPDGPHGVYVKLADGKYKDHALRGCVRIMNGMCSRELHGKPFVKDALRMGLQRTTRDESPIHLCRNEVYYTIRVDDSAPHYAYRIHNNQYSPIVDLFSAPKSFWRSILPEIPDLLLDNDDPYWGEALVAIFRSKGAKDATGCAEFVGGKK